MQTALADFVRTAPEGREADAILRSCVHCGFCLPACPTYRLLGDELDSPRGRIYLMKQLLEGEEVSARTQLHLDRCLTCRACESACPSGVRYASLLEIGRKLTAQRVRRSPGEALRRYLLTRIVPYRRRLRALLALARAVRPLLPATLRALVARRKGAASPPLPWPPVRHARRVLILQGCVQSVLESGIDAAAAQVLDRTGISAVRIAGTGCCGAVAHHLSAHAQALRQARRNVEVLAAGLGAGVEAVVLTASACASMVGEYGRLLRDEPRYAAGAARISALTRDISQVIAAERPALEAALHEAATAASDARHPQRVACHNPCTLQHALRLGGVVEPLLAAAGFTLTRVADAHSCCGSAGTYSILQPRLSQALRRAKLAALEADAPEVIATANIGCLMHLRDGATVPVRHWVELVAARLAPRA